MPTPHGISEPDLRPSAPGSASRFMNLAAAEREECQFFSSGILKPIFGVPTPFLPELGLLRPWRGSVTIRSCRMEECMQFRPLHDRVVVKRIEAEERTAR